MTKPGDAILGPFDNAKSKMEVCFKAMLNFRRFSGLWAWKLGVLKKDSLASIVAVFEIVFAWLHIFRSFSKVLELHSCKSQRSIYLIRTKTDCKVLDCVNVNFSWAFDFTGKKGLTQKEQIEVVRRFRDGGYNTLVATCVGEEGLDIGEVDLIVCYDVSKSPIRLVQRMGRTGRKRAGKIIVLVTQVILYLLHENWAVVGHT